MADFQKEIRYIHMILIRLERISVDSYWAHRASGLRGALLRILESMENDGQYERQKLELLIITSYKILENAGKELIR